QGSGVATPLHEAGYTDAVVHRFEIKTNTGKPGGVHIRITRRVMRRWAWDAVAIEPLAGEIGTYLRAAELPAVDGRKRA
ncbi:hypothetical protein, partial [Pseudomonas aeruginosa]